MTTTSKFKMSQWLENDGWEISGTGGNCYAFTKTFGNWLVMITDEEGASVQIDDESYLIVGLYADDGEGFETRSSDNNPVSLYSEIGAMLANLPAYVTLEKETDDDPEATTENNGKPVPKTDGELITENCVREKIEPLGITIIDDQRDWLYIESDCPVGEDIVKLFTDAKPVLDASVDVRKQLESALWTQCDIWYFG